MLTSSISARITVYQHTICTRQANQPSPLWWPIWLELAERDIAINAIAPGGTATDMATNYSDKYIHPALSGVASDAVMRSMNALGRLVQPAEIAAVVTFLLSTDASYINGTTIEAAGGWSHAA